MFKQLNEKLQKFLESDDFYTAYLMTGEATTAYDLFMQFFEDKQSNIKTYQWDLIPKEQYHNALKMYMRDGANFKFPESTLISWIELICKNIDVLQQFTSIAGHDPYFPFEDFNMAFMGEDEITDYYEAAEVLEKEGFYDWAVLPDGSDAISDYGIRPIIEILMELSEFPTKEQMIIAINRCLDVVHQRGDLASAFIQGGAKSCTEISNT